MLGTDGPHPLGSLRAGLVLTAFMALTLPLMPVQALLLRLSTRAARRLPHWYHRQVCRLLAVRLSVEGRVATDRPVLIVANHTSWLDIPVLSAVAPLSFIAKAEVGRWPFIKWLARLQRTVFIDRTRRAAVGDTTSEMAQRLAMGEALVLFAEGTSSDGNRVLPFMSALLGAVWAPRAEHGPAAATAVQTLAIVYARLHGLPLARADRPLVGWYGDMQFGRHAWALLRAGPLDVRIRIGEPEPIDRLGDRKRLSQRSEAAVRADVVRGLRGLPPDHPVELAHSAGQKPRLEPAVAQKPSRTWT